MNSNTAVDLSTRDQQLISELKRITNPRTGAYKKVFPADMVIYVPYRRSTRQMRRDMSRLAEKQFLIRLGPRKGYRVHPQYLQ